MALPQSREEHRKSASMSMVVSQLLTPEEPLAHSFSKPKSDPLPSFIAIVPSPPASPAFRPFSTDAVFRQTDDLLYPDHSQVESSSVPEPLFHGSNRWASPERHDTSDIEDSLSLTSSESPRNRPTASSKKSPKTIHATVQGARRRKTVGPVALYNTYGLDYYRYCLSQVEDLRARKMSHRQLPPLVQSRASHRDRYTQDVLSSLNRPARIEKFRAPSKPKAVRVVPSKAGDKEDVSTTVIKHDSPAKRHRRRTSTPDASYRALPHAAQPKPRTRAAPSKKIEGNNADWAEIPDHCPPLSTLDAPGKKLTVSWANTNALDLSNDPDKVHLHPQELEVAQTLRLRCNAYLANKRRIFAARVAFLREGKEFNKTSAQNATQIDVNKASRLWAAFDAIGWFDEKWFKAQL